MKRHGKMRLAAFIAPLTLFGVAIAVACSPDSSPETTVPKLTAAKSAARVLSSEQQARLNAAKARTRWVGDAHHAGMQVVIESITRLKKSKRPLPARGTADYCAIMEKVGDTTLAVLDQHRGVRRGKLARIAQVRQDKAFARCFPSLSVFGSPASPFLHVTPTIMQEYDPEVTGAYENYLDPMYYALLRSDGSVGGVRSEIDGVLAEAVSAGIPEGDLLALASFAGLVESSAREWNSFPWNIAGDPGSGGGGDEMSVFALRRWDDRPLKVVGADAVGCFSTVKGWGALKALLVGPAWVALGAECGIRGALASGVAIFGMI